MKASTNFFRLIFFASAFFVKIAYGGDECLGSAGAKVESLQGNLLFTSLGHEQWQSAKLFDHICQGSRIKLDNYSRATLSLPNGIILRLDEGTTLTLNTLELPKNPASVQAEAKSTFGLIKGFVHFISRTPKHLLINTPIANAGPEGTEFAMQVDENQSLLWVYEGSVKFYNNQGNLNLTSGQSAIAKLGIAPREQIDIKPLDAVNWALYYPPLIDYSNLEVSDKSTELGKAVASFRQGKIEQAVTVLDKLIIDRPSIGLLKIRAAIRLMVGRVDLAKQDIFQIQKHSANDADATALLSVIALVQNNKDNALQLAKQAVEQDSQSPVAYAALSYALQGSFQLDEALNAAAEAVKQSPNDALLWTRKAELELSLGLTDRCSQSVKQALVLDPENDNTLTISGFLFLVKGETDLALDTFQKAVGLDSASPLPRLGQAIAKIRNGEVQEGRLDLEVAATLDPNNSLIRSYLAKAYYEERRSHLAEDQLTLAKERDQNDPTPYFYDAINKQTINRPIEALHDMQKAIELNNNRAVYRSKLFLDSDIAARSASLGRIYNDLGFQQRGLLEGWNAINIDPGNFSAHRLLADDYQALPRHEIARLSELLKSQLLQPTNITPVQPQTAQQNILILDGLGPSITSFNEYNPLFSRDRFALQASGYYGGNQTVSDEVVQSGVWDNFSYSLGQFHYETDGFRENNKRKNNAYNVFAQTQISQNNSLQIELRRVEQESGDINEGFFKDQFSRIAKSNTETNIVRGGFHHKFTEHSDLLASIVYREESNKNLDDSQGLILDSSAKTDGSQYELQYLTKYDYFDLSIGANYLANQNEQLGLDLANPATPGSILQLVNNDKFDHQAFYAYSNIKPISNLIITAGVSQDFYQETTSLQTNVFGFNFPGGDKLDRAPLNPKFGVTWFIFDKTTARFALFQSLTRGIIQRQTLEPTQVAGFNQFFDDINGSIAKRIGFGVDHKFNKAVFSGFEISGREIDVPFISTNELFSSEFLNTKWREKNARAYLNWTPAQAIALGVNYNYEKFKRNTDFFDTTNNNSNFFTDLETHRTDIFTNFYHPSGFIGKLNLSYLDQSGNIVNRNTQVQSLNDTSFWIFDAEIGYRLMKRHGLLTLGVRNLLNERFNFQGTDVNSPNLPQGRILFSRVTLSF
ncbi:MAG: TonB-dependent receptor [Methylobacter sp.]|nr:MAG: TonB-dependent receptor [Methylobacter sp.]